MKTVTGVFLSRGNATLAVQKLREVVRPERINLLMPEASDREIQNVPTTQDMPPVGQYIGGVLGGALGLGLGASVLLPGLGTITAIGAVATALIGLSGAVAGGAAGKTMDEKGSEGLPIDELYVYKDALRKGRTVAFAFVDDDVQAAAASKAMIHAGAQSIDAARETGAEELKSAEQWKYPAVSRK